MKAQVPSPTPKASAPMTSDSTVFVGYMSRRMNIRMVMNWKSPNSQSARFMPILSIQIPPRSAPITDIGRLTDFDSIPIAVLVKPLSK